MKKNPIKIIEINPKTNYELGFILGKETKNQINYAIKNTNYLHDKNKELKKIFLKYKEIVEKDFPELIKEIKGIAKSSKNKYETILKMNIRELATHSKLLNNQENDNCSTITLKTNQETIISHNEDGPAYNNIFFVKTSLPNSNNKILSLAYPGQLIGFAVNLIENKNKTTYISCNTLSCNNTKIGIPKRFITREMINQTSLNKIKKTILNPKRAQGQNYTISKNNKIINLEVSTNNYHQREIKENYAHANNFTEKKMLQYESRGKEQATFFRYKNLNKTLKKAKNEKDIIKILSSHKDFPKCICMHKEKNKPTHLATLANIIYNTKNPKILKINLGETCKNNHKEIILE